MSFVCGVIEGFYGRPWHPAQRRELLGDLRRFLSNDQQQDDSKEENYSDRTRVGVDGMYMYAPKDDAKHRALWRERYGSGKDELGKLRELLLQAQAADIEMVYAIAPGLDMRLHLQLGEEEEEGGRDDARDGEEEERREVEALLGKLEQLWSIMDGEGDADDENGRSGSAPRGFRNFAVLFDDIPEPTSEAGWRAAAQAQARVCNAVWAWLQAKQREHEQGQEKGQRCRLFFCPTQYCGMMAVPSVTGSVYLQTLGQDLAVGVDFFWTGPLIISDVISRESLQELRGVIRRKPILWDNLHANDYDLRRIFLGPYSGRDGIADEIVGVLSNPNCEYEANYVPLHTLGYWAQRVTAGREYVESEAMARAVRDWLPRFRPAAAGTPHGSVSQEDVEFMCDLFYLPFRHGTAGTALLTAFDRLLRAADASDARGVAVPVELCDQVVQACGRISLLFERVTELERRELCYSLYTYLWEVKEEADLMRGYANALRAGGKIVSGVFRSRFHEPRTYRGGLVAELQRRLVMLAHGTFAHSPGPSTSDTFVIRQATPEDEHAMYRVCLETGDSGDDGTPFYADPHVLGERWVGPYLFHEPDLAFVLEDPGGRVCGYVLAARDSASFYETCRHEWFPKMAAKHPVADTAAAPEGAKLRDAEVIKSFHDPSEEELYFPKEFEEWPSHLHIDLVPHAQGRGLGGRLIRHLEAQLRQRGSTGVFLEMSPNNTRALHFYKKLGFTELKRTDDTLFLSKRLEQQVEGEKNSA